MLPYKALLCNAEFDEHNYHTPCEVLTQQLLWMEGFGAAAPVQKSHLWGLLPKRIQLGSGGASEGSRAV